MKQSSLMNYSVETSAEHIRISYTQERLWQFTILRCSWIRNNSEEGSLYIPTPSVQIFLFKRWKCIFAATSSLYNFKLCIFYLSWL